VQWYAEKFIPAVQQRGAAVIAARKASSAASAAKAICDHVRNWVLGTCDGQIVSMAVPSNGAYGVTKVCFRCGCSRHAADVECAQDLIFSFPVTCHAGKWHIVDGLTLSPFSKKMLQETEKELIAERDSALSFTQ